MIAALRKMMEEKKVFEEATRCPECYSDQIYVFQDTDGGMCTKCKCLLTGIIRGGLSKQEVMRLRGDLKGADAEKIQNDIDRKSDAAEKASNDVAKLKADLAGLNKSQVMAPVKDTSKTPQREVVKPAEGPKGPSVVEKAKAWLFGGDKEKEPKISVPRPPPPPIKVAPPPPVAAPVAPMVAPPSKIKETGLPAIGERWSVGPCGTCGVRTKTTSIVRRSKSTGTTSKFLELENGYYGCFFCAKKA